VAQDNQCFHGSEVASGDPQNFSGCWLSLDLPHNKVLVSSGHVLRVDLTHAAEQYFPIVLFFILEMPDMFRFSLDFALKSGLMSIFAPCF